MKNTNRYILLVVLFSVAFSIGYFHAFKGFDLTDEGWYASTAMRYSLGDRPFRDEILSSNRSFDILLSCVFRLYPDIALRQLRLMGNFIHASGIALIFLFLSGYAMPPLTALLCLIMFLANNFFGILTPSYSSLSSDFSLISIALWLFSMAANNRIFRAASAVFAGLFLALAAISYSSIALAVSVPFIFLLFCYANIKEPLVLLCRNILRRNNSSEAKEPFSLLLRRRIIGLVSPGRHRELIRPTAVFICTFLTVIAAAFLIMICSGILPDFIRSNMESLKTYPLGAKGPTSKLYTSARNFSRHIPYLLSPSGSGPIRQFKIGLISFTLICSLIAAFLRRAPGADMGQNLKWSTVRKLLFAWGLVLSFIYALSSSSGANCILGLTPLFLVSMLSLYGSIKRYSGNMYIRNPRRFIWPALYFIVVIAFLIEAMNYNYRSIYKDAEPSRLTAAFIHPKLAGIYSTPEKVRVMEELLNYLKPRIKPKSYLLAYNHIPGLYFLTDTRPAYSSAWARDEWTLSLNKRLLRRMIENNRIPEYCVRMLVSPNDWKTPLVYDDEYPLDLFVKKNYRLEKTIYPFEIWRLDEGSNLKTALGKGTR